MKRLESDRAKHSMSGTLSSNFFAAFLIVQGAFCVGTPGNAYPVFQEFSEKNSGRTVSCAMCHTNDSGPQGDAPGQLGTLTPEELEKLTKARGAFEPGSQADNPILNEFGNKIIHKLGRKTFISLQKKPEKLAELLGDKEDTDGDGIPDSREYLDGTDPTNQYHGDPWKLFLVNLDRFKFHVAITAAAILALDFGFASILKGMALASRKQ